MTIMEKKGRDLRRKKMVMSWAYASSYQKPMSIPNSMTLQLPRFGLDYVLAYPEGFELPESTIESAKAAAKKSGGSFEITHDMESAFKDADIIYPKSWGPWMTTTDADEARR